MGIEQALIPSTIIVRSQEVLFSEVDSELVLMSVDQGFYFGLDAIGRDIWTRLEKPVRVADLCTALADDYQGDPAVIEQDVMDLLHRLAGRKLISVVP